MTNSSRRAFLQTTTAVAATCYIAGFAQDTGTSNQGDYRHDVPIDVQTAINSGLAYLAGTQNNDGSFGDNFLFRGNIAVTSLAGLAMMAGGNMPGSGTYGKNVLRAMQYILDKEQKTPAGYLNNADGLFQQAPMYGHGFGTLFLCELYGMVPNSTLQLKLKNTIERAVNLIIQCQNSEGGWRYEPVKQQADSSATICQIMALRSARNAGFYVPGEVAKQCEDYVRSCQTLDGGFSYFSGQGPSAFPRSAAGLVALYCAGVYSGKEIDRALKYLIKFKPTQDSRISMANHYFYGHYYAAQAMWTAGPAYWNEWYPAISRELLMLRRTSAGAWIDPTICNHYATAMACIILQLPNNYLPILQK